MMDRQRLTAAHKHLLETDAKYKKWYDEAVNEIFNKILYGL